MLIYDDVYMITQQSLHGKVGKENEKYCHVQSFVLKRRTMLAKTT